MPPASWAAPAAAARLRFADSLLHKVCFSPQKAGSPVPKAPAFIQTVKHYLFLSGFLLSFSVFGQCGSGMYQWYFPGFLSLDPGGTGGTYECISNWETPEQWMFAYTNVLRVTNAPVVPWVPEPGDLWVSIEQVQPDQQQANTGPHKIYGDLVNMTVHGCVDGTDYQIYGSSSLVSKNWTDVFDFTANGESTQVELWVVPPQSNCFFKEYGQKRPYKALVIFTCGLFLALICKKTML